MFIVMWNCPGFLPGMDPEVLEDFNVAKGVVLQELQELLARDDLCDLEEIQTAVTLIETLSCPFCVVAGGVAYSVTKVQGP